MDDRFEEGGGWSGAGRAPAPSGPPSGWPPEPQFDSEGFPSTDPYRSHPYAPVARPLKDPVRPQPRVRRRGFWGGLTGALVAIGAYAKYLLAVGLKFGAFKTALSLLISFGAYTVLRGPEFAAALVVMILIHEMGHVVEIRRQGMQATAPLFIPFFGAAIFQRSHPVDALHQALIGIAGPIAGTLAASAAFVLYLTTGLSFFLFAALIGFFLNLFNLIPFGMLDGGWVLSAASKWFQLVGLALLAAVVLFTGLLSTYGIVVIALLLMFGVPAMMQRFRDDRSPYYQSVPTGARWALAGAWLALVVYLGFMLLQAGSLAALPR